MTCEECNLEMHPGTLPDGTPTMSCDGCGWSENVEYEIVETEIKEIQK